MALLSLAVVDDRLDASAISKVRSNFLDAAGISRACSICAQATAGGKLQVCRRAMPI
jgi:hypothetical protein